MYSAQASPRKVNFGWISEAWQIYSAQAGTWILATVIYILIGIALSAVLRKALGIGFGAGPYGAPSVPGRFGGSFPMLGTGVYSLSPANDVVNLISLVYSAFILGGLYRMANNQVRGLPISVGDVFSGGPVFLQMLVYHILFSVIFTVGVLLCFFPCLAVGGLLWPGYAMVADRESFGNAFSRSFEAMKSDWFMAALLFLVWALIVIVSAIPCGLGLLITVPMSYLIGSLIYRDMLGAGQPAAGSVYAGQPAPGSWPPPPSPTGAGTPENIAPTGFAPGDESEPGSALGDDQEPHGTPEAPQ